MVKRGKRYNAALASLEPDSVYSAQDAVSIVKKNATSKFDETIELHLKTGADPRHADQMLRGISILPHGTGKNVRTLVFCEGDAIDIALGAGAEYAGSDELISDVEGGWLEFDVSIATPDIMGKISKLGRILGRKGLMPNPRTGTVVPPDDIAKAVEDSKKGRIEFKLDRNAIVHVPIGKASFEEQKLIDNLATLMDTLLRAKPSGVKGDFLKTAFLTTTMGPSVSLDIADISNLEVK